MAYKIDFFHKTINFWNKILQKVISYEKVVHFCLEQFESVICFTCERCLIVFSSYLSCVHFSTGLVSFVNIFTDLYLASFGLLIRKNSLCRFISMHTSIFTIF